MSVRYGLIVSAVIHVLILSIPISMTATPEKQEIELFMTIEETRSIRSAIPKQQKQAMLERLDTRSPLVPRDIEQRSSITLHGETTYEDSGAIVEKREITASAREQFSGEPATDAEKIPVPIDTEFGSAIAPSFLHREMPVYPAFARKLGKEGRVVLRLTINERGELVDVEVVEREGFGFVDAAVEAVRKSTFAPAYKNGRPVPSRALLPVRFTLRRDS